MEARDIDAKVAAGMITIKGDRPEHGPAVKSTVTAGGVATAHSSAALLCPKV